MPRRPALSAQNVLLQCFRLWIPQERRKFSNNVTHLDPFTVIVKAAVLALTVFQLAFAHSHMCLHSFLWSSAYSVHEASHNNPHRITSVHIIGTSLTWFFVSSISFPQSHFVCAHPSAFSHHLPQSITKTINTMESAISSTAPSPERPRAARNRSHASPLHVRDSASPSGRDSSSDRGLSHGPRVLPT